MAKNVSLAPLHVCASECVTNLHNFLFSQLSDGVNISITDEGLELGVRHGGLLLLLLM